MKDGNNENDVLNEIGCARLIKAVVKHALMTPIVRKNVKAGFSRMSTIDIEKTNKKRKDNRDFADSVLLEHFASVYELDYHRIRNAIIEKNKDYEENT